MRKTKLKNDFFWQAGTLPFVALWAGSYAAAWVALLYVVEWLDDIGNFSQQETNNIAISFLLLFAGLLHVQIVERLLKQSMRRWMLYTLLGAVITFFTFRDSSRSSGNYLPMLLTTLSLLVPVSLVQTAWLWRRVKSAWLWPLASIVAAIVFVSPLRSGSGTDELFILSTLLYGLIQGGIMRYLWTQPLESDKAKIDFDIDQQTALDDRARRLQTSESPPATWHARDDHAAEHKAQ